jgi:hypothetical protein
MVARNGKLLFTQVVPKSQITGSMPRPGPTEVLVGFFKTPIELYSLIYLAFLLGRTS